MLENGDSLWYSDPDELSKNDLDDCRTRFKTLFGKLKMERNKFTHTFEEVSELRSVSLKPLDYFAALSYIAVAVKEYPSSNTERSELWYK